MFDPYMLPYGFGHPSPFLSYLARFQPRTLKEQFRWCEYLFFQSPHILSALRKLSEYPVTELVYEGKNDPKAVEQYRELFEETLNIKAHLILHGINLFVYGNAFTSLYPKTVRYIKCPSCGNVFKADRLRNYDLKYGCNAKKVDKKLITQSYFTFWCPECKKTVKSYEINDLTVKGSGSLRFYHWDPKTIEIGVQPIFGDPVYKYYPSRKFRQAVKDNDPGVISETPLDLLEVAVLEKGNYTFTKGMIYHSKLPTIAGINNEWGIPPIVPAIISFMYATILRKANEAIALDHLVPMRIIYPQAAGIDPTRFTSLGKLREEIKSAILYHRTDPLHIFFSPVPVGVESVNGQGRALLTLGEVENAEYNIIVSLGIPPEFYKGGLTASATNISLRMLENQLQSYVGQLNGFLKWVVQSVHKHLGWPIINVKLAKFKLIDDLTQKQIVLQLSELSGGEISLSTLFDMMGLDLKEEREKRKQETLDRIRWEKELEKEQMKLTSNLEQQMMAYQATQAGTITPEQKEMLMQQADQIVQQLVQLPENLRKTQLDQLSKTDFVLYSVVVQKLEMYRNMEEEQAKAMVRQQQG